MSAFVSIGRATVVLDSPREYDDFMLPEDYVAAIAAKYSPANNSVRLNAVLQANIALSRLIREWAGAQLHELKLSGSHAKGTAIAGSTDLDLLISLKPDTQQTLSEIYSLLNRKLIEKGYAPRQQNVSLRVTHAGIDVDLVPAKLQGTGLVTQNHWIYRRKRDTHQQTNIDRHIQIIRQSGRIEDIRIAKVWRQLHNLDFPSFYLELSVMRALESNTSVFRSQRFVSVLQYLADDFSRNRIVDPANTNNIISDDLTEAEKAVISRTAAASLTRNWEQVLW